MSPLLETYLRANLLLVISAVIPLLLRPLLLKRNGQNWLAWLRWMQFLLLFTLAATSFAAWVPQGTVPDFSLVVRQPLAELAGRSAGFQTAWQAVDSVTQGLENVPSAQPAWRSLLPLFRQHGAEAMTASLLALLTFFLARFVFRATQLHRSLLRTTPLRKVGSVTVALSDEVSVPFSAWSCGHAYVVIPNALLANWRDFKLAVTHELQHHRQRDTLWAQLVEGLQALFFFNPALTLWRRWISELQELSCDGALIGRKISFHDYGSCLVRVAETALENRRLLAGTAGMATGFENPTYFKSFLRRRIEMLRHANHSQNNRPLQWATGTLSALLIFTVAVSAHSVKPPLALAEGTVATDPQIQKIAEGALKAALIRHKASLGFVVVSDPVTGRILAVANEDRMEKEAERTPHWALSLRFGPASLIKALIAATAVDKGKTRFDEMHDCEKSHYMVDGRLFQDWKSFDKLSTADTVIQSSNLCGIKVGQKLGAEGVLASLKDYGFGPGGTAEGFPEAKVGEVVQPRSADDVFYTATVATGYGNLYLSPIEVVQAFGAIANGGNLLKPQSSATPVEPQVIRRVLSEKTAAETRTVLADVMVRGTAMKSASKLYRLGGKTATGYSRTHVGHDTLGGDSNMAAFVGFGPVENPRVVIFTMIENPTDQKGVHGSTHAAPVFTEVAEKTLQYLKVARN